MKKIKLRIAIPWLLPIVLFMFSCERDDIQVSNEVDENVVEEIHSEAMVEGLVRIKLERTTSQSMSVSLKSGKVKTDISNMDTLFNSIGVRTFKRTFPYAGKFEARTVESGLDLWYDVIYDTTQVKLASVLSRFSNLNEVVKTEGVPHVKSTGSRFRSIQKVVERAAALKATTTTYPFNDNFLSLQWHYYNDGSLDDGIEGCDINLFDAWKIQTGSPEVIVSVVDGGIEFDHEDLEANMWVNSNESQNGMDDDSNGYADDVYGYNFVSRTGSIAAHSHGTHVAGTIGAVNNNKIGVCGIAGGDGITQGVRLMSCQVFEEDADGNDVSAQSFAEAIKYGADNGAIISQNSWGYDGATSIPTHMQEAIDYFIKYAGLDEHGNQVGPMKGGVVIFAAGNDGLETGLPASYEPVVAVAAVAPDFKATYYTNYGNWVDISAPGGTYDDNGKYADAGYMIASTSINDEYVWNMGTSMACPHVSGVAALIASEFGGDGFTPSDLKDRLFQGTVDIDSYNPDYEGKLGIGIVNAAAALADLNAPAPAIVSDLYVESYQNTIDCRWSVTGNTDLLKATNYTFYYSNSSFSMDDVLSERSDIQNDLSYSPHKEIGQSITHTIEGLDFSTTYYVGVVASDLVGISSGLSNVVTVLTDDNNPPKIIAEQESELTLKAHETKQLVFNIQDPEAHEVSWSLNDPSGYAISSGSSYVARIYINGLTTPAGTYSASITAQDEWGASSTYNFTYTVEENHAPVVTIPMEDTYIGDPDKEYTFNLTEYFNDEDGETLSYSISYNESMMSASVNSGQLTIKPTSYGLSTFTVTASDALEESASFTFQIMIRDDSSDVDVFPNPVVDKLNIRMGNSVEGSISVEIFNSDGVLRDTKDTDISTFSPAQLDLSNLSAGSYNLKIHYKSQTFERNIVKL
ncbi:S8 family serine peptidase [Carboxylicivirga linearis]|uniref:S8 family serine peptidase n=1 Tax=Carboxylicivirga linearis TaxID=1628157 RepID=A0ABS5JWZ9_9BACT|nr:S8 family serine peptidase [Carboxylicivirga linearis]MBS2099430.1 S8 family serine peptidase [Carboxylicivirga linearis]